MQDHLQRSSPSANVAISSHWSVESDHRQIYLVDKAVVPGDSLWRQALPSFNHLLGGVSIRKVVTVCFTAAVLCELGPRCVTGELKGARLHGASVLQGDQIARS